MNSINYRQSGVDPEKAANILKDFGQHLKTRPRDKALLSGIGPFASCYSLKDLVQKYPDPVLVTCCDGVGTKAKLAADWGLLEGLGADLVAMNVNDLLCVGANPLLFLDYYACGKLDSKQLTTLLHSIQRACELSECSLAGGETAEMPGLYSGDDFDLAGFCVGMADRENILGAERVQVGDTLVALASSGLHSNGYSLVRKLVERANLQPDDQTPLSTRSWQETLLEPTTIYVPLFKSLGRDSQHWSRELHAAAHLTGGGLFENLPRVLPRGVRARITAWKFPPLFNWIQETAQISTTEMLSTFNCGVGMLAVCTEAQSETLIRVAQEKRISAWKTGIIEAGASQTNEPEVLWE